jgi:hypothetical protein
MTYRSLLIIPAFRLQQGTYGEAMLSERTLCLTLSEITNKVAGLVRSCALPR